MIAQRFLNREEEIELLNSRFESDTAELLVVYGRRRLGKSALVRFARAPARCGNHSS